MRSYVALALASLATLVVAQNNTAGSYTIDPDSVSNATRGRTIGIFLRLTRH